MVEEYSKYKRYRRYMIALDGTLIPTDEYQAIKIDGTENSCDCGYYYWGDWEDGQYICGNVLNNIPMQGYEFPEVWNKDDNVYYLANYEYKIGDNYNTIKLFDLTGYLSDNKDTYLNIKVRYNMLETEGDSSMPSEKFFRIRETGRAAYKREWYDTNFGKNDDEYSIRILVNTMNPIYEFYFVTRLNCIYNISIEIDIEQEYNPKYSYFTEFQYKYCDEIKIPTSGDEFHEEYTPNTKTDKDDYLSDTCDCGNYDEYTYIQSEMEDIETRIEQMSGNECNGHEYTQESTYKIYDKYGVCKGTINKDFHYYKPVLSTITIDEYEYVINENLGTAAQYIVTYKYTYDFNGNEINKEELKRELDKTVYFIKHKGSASPNVASGKCETCGEWGDNNTYYGEIEKGDYYYWLFEKEITEIPVFYYIQGMTRHYVGAFEPLVCDPCPWLSNETLYNLSYIEIPKSVTKISKYAFRNSPIETIIFKGKTTTIDDEAFNGANRLENISLENISTIGNSAFTACVRLKEITIPLSLANVGDWAFKDCTSLQAINWENDYNASTTFGVNAFQNCYSLTSVTIPVNTNLNGNIAGAFQGCNNLTDIIFVGVGSIEGFVKENHLTSVTSVTIDESSTLRSIGECAFSYPNIKEFTTYKWYDDSKLSTAFCNVNNGLFYYPKGSNYSQTINHLTSLGWKCIPFNGDKPEPIYEYHLKPIDSEYYDCDFTTHTKYQVAVYEYSIDNGATWDLAEPYQFKRSGETIPNSNECLLEAVVLTFNDGTSSTDIFANGVIDDRKYFNNGKITKVVINDGITSIGSSAFWLCGSITSVTIGNSVISIGRYAFQNCSSLTSVTIPNSVTEIGSSAFNGCSGLTSVTIPNSLTSIGGMVFSNCSGLTNVIIPDSVTSIGGSAFYYCSSLTSVTIPNSVTEIGDSAFANCTNLKSINYNGTKAQFKAITRSSSWHNNVPSSCRVYCTDGDDSITWF